MRIVIVSNRLPVVVENGEEGWRLKGGSGGLVSALAPVLRRRGGLWIGWPGSAGDESFDVDAALTDFGRREGYDLVPVPLTDEDRRGFYEGFSNQIIWPLFHDLQSQCNFEPEFWTSYLDVNTKFADVALKHIQADDFVWVQDYHLMGLGDRLRRQGVTGRMGFFLHVPFPPPDMFCKLPWRTEVLESLLAYDVLGFQAPRDLENFSDCMRKLLPAVRRNREKSTLIIKRGERTCRVGAFPIGIDFDEFAAAAATPSVEARARELRNDMQDQQIILGLDRLDYTKGIPYRLRAFQLALRRYPQLHRAVTMMQVVIPSREAVPEYQELKGQIEQLVSQINGEFTQPGWVPIHHVFRSLDYEELVAYYRLADVALLTPIKDGMNLVCKEYCACQVDGDGVLILSEFAGAADQLRRDAVLINPFDMDRVAEALMQAVARTRQQRRPAMRRLRLLVKRYDVYWWVDQFLEACGLGSSGDPRVGRIADRPVETPVLL
jgi:trehalose 6-phosphate synthase